MKNIYAQFFDCKSQQRPHTSARAGVADKIFFFLPVVAVLILALIQTGCTGFAGVHATNSTSSSTDPPSTTAPVISTPPLSQTVTAGQTATFAVAASGTAPLSYQWSKNGTTIPGAQAASYITPATGMSDNGAQFAVAVSDAAGTVNSAAAILTVTAAPTAPSISTQPLSQTIVVGQTATFSVSASGTGPLSYQWNKNGTAVGSATSPSYTTPATTSADNGEQFTVTVTNSVSSVTSNVAALTVNPATLVLNANTTSLNFGTVNLGSSGGLSVTFTNAGNSNVTISNVSVSGAGFAASGISTGQTVTPGQTATLNATFTPATAVGVSGSVTVTSNAANSPATIALSGTGVPATHSVTLSWSPAASTVVGYNIYSSTVSGGPYTQLNSTLITTTQYVDTTVQGGQTYFFVATSVDSSNDQSAYSNIATATIPSP